MSVRVEWHDARHVSAEVYPPGNDDWVGAGDQGDDYVVCISTDEVSAIHGSKEAIRDFAERLWRQVREATEDDDVWKCPGCHAQVEPSDVRRHASECDKYDGRHGY